MLARSPKTPPVLSDESISKTYTRHNAMEDSHEA